MALYLKEQGKLQSSVVATIMSNGALKEFLNKHGIELDTCNVGDKYVLEKLKAMVEILVESKVGILFLVIMQKLEMV
ncbi:phosphoglucosamine mutase [Campylobacter jejuni]|nr:phosphoglucosamine mutase [Campylobacter jejuni]